MRYIARHVEADLLHKMVFVGGPRQCGKTTLAKALLAAAPGAGRYLNWDEVRDRKRIRERRFGDADERTVLDELHKMRAWKGWLKGVFDTRQAGHQILVTGSARLDVYRRGGDSLLGRYHYWRLHPFCLDELPENVAPPEALERLMNLGGFPEPFVRNDARHARRWRRERYERVLRDDVRDLESVRQISTLELFVEALRERVGSPIVLSNIAGDLQVSPHTLKHWLEVLERMYLIFVVRPWSHKVARSLQKAPKVYFFDNGDVLGDEGARFENLVATHLLKRLQFFEDRDGFRYALHFLRDKDKREVDFVVVKERRAVALIEAKLSDDVPAKHLCHFAVRLPGVWAMQVVGNLDKGFRHAGIEVRSAYELFVKRLPLHKEPSW